MTIDYDESGAVAPEQKAWPDKTIGYSEDHFRDEEDQFPQKVDKSLNPDMSGTVETSDTSGDARDASAASTVFSEADELFATHRNADSKVAPEGVAQVPKVDSAATGDDALKPDYSQTRTPLSERDEKREEVAAEQGEPTTTVDTTEAGSPVTGFDASADPGEHTVVEVIAFLKDASPADAKKVIVREKKGQNRKGITGE